MLFSMTIEIITIGDEILSGNIVDTNTTYLADQLWRQGLIVSHHTAVRDDVEKISDALLRAAKRCKAVLVTGGLGPTADDFTIEVAAKAFGVGMVTSQEAMQALENRFAKMGRQLRENNRKQALVPEGSVVYINAWGTAPGVHFVFEGVPFYFLPGVPREMKGLFEAFVFPDIKKRLGGDVFFEGRFYKCTGVAESELDHQLANLYDDRTSIQNVRVGFRAHFPEIFIKLSAWGKTQEEAVACIKPVEEAILQRVGQYVFGGELDTLEAVTGELLRQQGKTVAVAESCTGGLIANRLTNVAGSSDYFLGGIVSYDNSVKQSMLGVTSETLTLHGAVSSECALQMAMGARRAIGSDYAIAVTGIAGPGGGSDEKPVGTVHIAIVDDKNQWKGQFHFPYSRERFKQMVATTALDQLRRLLKYKS